MFFGCKKLKKKEITRKTKFRITKGLQKDIFYISKHYHESHDKKWLPRLHLCYDDFCL